MTDVFYYAHHSSTDAAPNGTQNGVRRHAGRGVPRVFLRPIATPLPIGLAALAVGSILLAGKQLHWVAAGQGHEIALCLLGFVVPLQLISFVFGYLSRDEGAASALAVLSGTWLAVGLVTLTSAPGSTSGGLGMLLIAAAGALLIPVAVAASSKPLVSLVFFVTAARFLITGLYQLGVPAVWETVAGILGAVLTGLAWYAAAAFALEAGNRKAILPVFRIPGRAGPNPKSTDAPLGPVSHDAGVRSHL